MVSGSIPDDGSDERNRILHRLADAMNIAPTAFFGASVCDLGQTNELLSLWHKITDVQVRAELLAIMRTAASHA